MLSVVQSIIRSGDNLVSHKLSESRLEGIDIGDLEEEELFILLRQTRPKERQNKGSIAMTMDRDLTKCRLGCCQDWEELWSF